MKKQKFKLTTPVLFLVFNRLNTTKQVFSEIRKAKPSKLFIASDGPRRNKPGEKETVETVRKWILKNINWKCKVRTLFRRENLGCKYAVSSAIDWFFENVESGIILEDDCLPAQSFFRFCQEMLEKYKNDRRIMQISGTNVEGKTPVKESYFFSNRFSAWGWATWRRAWNKYDVNMKAWKKARSSKDFLKISTGSGLLQSLKAWRIYQLTYLNRINTWDYQWIFACLLNRGICIIPRLNLITNIGFGSNATHTDNYGSDKKITRYNLRYPLTYNPDISLNKKYAKIHNEFYSGPSPFKKLLRYEIAKIKKTMCHHTL